MIIGTFEKRERYAALGEGIRKAFEWLAKNDIRKMKDGQYDVEGDKLFVLVQRYTTRQIDDAWVESHVKYIDVHYVAQGFEYIGYTPVSRAGKAISEYNEGDDEFRYHRDYETSLLLKEGDFAIIFPEDAHMPQRRALFPSEMVKACIKVAVG